MAKAIGVSTRYYYYSIVSHTPSIKKERKREKKRETRDRSPPPPSVESILVINYHLITFRFRIVLGSKRYLTLRSSRILQACLEMLLLTNFPRSSLHGTDHPRMTC